MKREWTPFNSSDFDCPVVGFLNTPLRITLAYAVLSGIWIVLSDFLLLQITPSEISFALYEIIKGLIFVGATAALLFLLIKKFSKDIQSEQEIREKKFDLASENLPAIVWTADNKGKVDYCNTIWKRQTGADVSELIQKGIYFFIHPEDIKKIGPSWRRAIRTKTRFEGKLRIRQWDGTYRWYLSRAIPVRDEANKFRGWIGTTTDIDEEKRAEEILRQSEEELSQSIKAKDQFIATISHELRTPMNVILGWSDLIKSGDVDQEMHAEAVDALYRNSKNLKILIDDLVDYSKIVSGKMQLNIEPVNIQTVVDGISKDYSETARNKHITWSSRADTDIHEYPGDPARISQVLTNLLDNAFKFTPAGGRVELRVHQDGDGTLIFDVEDSGKGIDPRFIPHLFHPFTQEDMASTRKFGGIGLGLAIVSKIVEAHCGQIQVYSNGKGKGTRFSVSFPPPRPEVKCPPMYMLNHPTSQTSKWA